jgi:hypothetical protein
MLFLRFLKGLLFPGQVTGPRTLRRLLLLALFLPVFLLTQTIHWLCLALDEVFFPAYRKVQVREPLFVVGLPRSGTSFLQRVLAQDGNRFTTTRLWELLFAPSIIQRKILLALGTLDRRLGSPLGRLFRQAEKGGFRWMEIIHEVSLTDPEEDYFLLLPAFACFLLVVPFPYQDALWELARFDLLPPAKRKPLMAFYHRAAQRHLYVAGPGMRLLSKNPSFTPLIRSLADTFPDARFLCCIRDPAQVVPSLLSSIRSGADLFGYDVSEPRIRDRYVEMLTFFARHAPSALSTLPPDRYAFVPLSELKSDLEGFILGVYDRFGWTPEGGFRERLRKEASRGKSYRSRHRYTLEEFGLSARDLQGRFDTLPIPADVHEGAGG